jgi:hypothetical protein
MKLSKKRLMELANITVNEDAAADAENLQKELIAMAEGLSGGANNTFGIKIGRGGFQKGFVVMEAEGPWGDLGESGKIVSGKTQEGETVSGKKTGNEAGELIVRLDTQENVVAIQASEQTIKELATDRNADQTMNEIYKTIQKKYPPSQYNYNVKTESGQYLILMQKK